MAELTVKCRSEWWQRICSYPLPWLHLRASSLDAAIICCWVSISLEPASSVSVSAVAILSVSVENMHGLILYFLFPQGHAFIMLPFDPTQEQAWGYCSKNQSAMVLALEIFDSRSVKLMNISRLLQDAQRLHHEARRMEVLPFSALLTWFVFTAPSLLIVFSQWFIKNVTVGSLPFQDQ